MHKLGTISIAAVLAVALATCTMPAAHAQGDLLGAGSGAAGGMSNLGGALSGAVNNAGNAVNNSPVPSQASTSRSHTVRHRQSRQAHGHAAHHRSVRHGHK